MSALRNLLALVLLASLAQIQGCGGASEPDSGPTVSSNVQPISVAPGPVNNVNLATTSVILCAPGSNSNCQVIDNIVLDTGSTGLRILSSAISASLGLVQQVNSVGTAVVECAYFVDGYTWGPVKLADLRIADERANSLPIQVIGDPDFPNVPSRCSSSGPSKNSVQELRANGILGMGVFRQDCGSACAQPNDRGMYYVCTSSVCQQAPLALAQQVQNPVTKFPRDNNGVIIRLPSVPAAGAERVDGTLVFGIGTQSNNGLGTATVIGVDPANGNFTTRYNGNALSASFLDSGSNGLFFSDSIAVCASASPAPGFYCPASTINASAVIEGANGASVSVAFSVANAAALLTANPGFSAFSNLGAPFAVHSFDWGLPFFYGRSVYTAIEGATTPAGAGPYVAF